MDEENKGKRTNALDNGNGTKVSGGPNHTSHHSKQTEHILLTNNSDNRSHHPNT